MKVAHVVSFHDQAVLIISAFFSQSRVTHALNSAMDHRIIFLWIRHA